MTKVFLLIIFTLGGFSANAYKKRTAKYITIKGYITKTSDYCGGARPSEEMLNILHTPQGLADKKIFIKIGTKNSSSLPVYRSVVTDVNGKFTVVLKSGVSYIFLEDWKGADLQVPKDTENTKWDAQCFKERYAQPDFSLRVKKSNNPKVNINFHIPCFYKPYCGLYSGPLPP